MRATHQQVLGPYFLANAPLTNRLYPTRGKGCRLAAKGSPIQVSGQVLSTDCKALSGAIVHVWVADPQGRYDNQDALGEPLNIPQSEQLYRGRIVTDSDGFYSFECLRPGNYFDAGAELWRPAHVHVMIEVKGYQTLVTQLYFSDDDAQNSHDIAGDDFFLPELALQLSPAIPAAGSTQTGTYNFVLQALDD